MEFNLVQLVKAGVLGFAVAIMLLAFFALRNLMSQMNAPAAALALIAREIRIYMGLSLAVVIVGVLWEWFNPKVQVQIDVSPQDIAGYDVRVGGKSVKLPEMNTIELNNGSLIVLELIKFERQIQRLETQINGLKEQADELKRAQLNRATNESLRSRESGL